MFELRLGDVCVASAAAAATVMHMIYCCIYTPHCTVHASQPPALQKAIADFVALVIAKEEDIAACQAAIQTKIARIGARLCNLKP